MEEQISTKICKNCGENFQITDEDFEYYDENKIPAPTLCPDCRQQRRLAWRNERTLYKRKCDATGKDIISVYSPDSPTGQAGPLFPVYENEYWYSDKWDPLQYGQDFDFSRPFFEQFEELMNKVPQLSRSAVNNQNSYYTNQSGWNKNCYMTFEADYNENCIYSNNIYDSKNSMDIYLGTKCELCYDCLNCQKCYNIKYSQNCDNCFDSLFLKNCIGCSNCFGCVNLRNKKYHYLNEKYSEEEYNEKINSLDLKTYEQIETAKKKFQEFTKQFPHKHMTGTQNENSTGNYLSNTQNCQNCFEVNHSQDCKFVYNSRYMKKCYDIMVFGSTKGAEFCCDNHETGGGVRNIYFSDQVWIGCYNVMYSKLCCNNSHDLFGCIGLRHQEYCIFNKKYSKEEYESLRSRIIEHMKKTGEWGEFFPIQISPYGYNETLAQDYFPMKKEEALEKGYKWKEYSPPDTPDKIIKEVLTCKKCQKSYKIIEEESKFYEKMKLPTPEKCPDCRHKSRFNLKNPHKLHTRTCQKCGEEIQTTYSSDRPEIVYCEKCYLESVL